jgi:hypothetical protein
VSFPPHKELAVSNCHTIPGYKIKYFFMIKIFLKYVLKLNVKMFKHVQHINTEMRI